MSKTKTNSFRSQFMKTFWEAKTEEDVRRAKKRAAKEAEGTRAERAVNFLIRWMKRIFYSLFFGMAVYVLVMTFSLSMPMFLAILLRTLGYNLGTMAELLLAGFAGLFFTAWMFVISFFLVRTFWRIYWRAMKKTAKRAAE